MNRKLFVAVFLTLLFINPVLYGQTERGHVKELSDKRIEKYFESKGIIQKANRGRISSLANSYCSTDGYVDLIPDSWDPDATKIEWTVTTFLAGEGEMGHPTWGELIGSGTSAIFRFYPDRVESKYLNGARIYLAYVQKDNLNFTLIGDNDYTFVYEIPVAYNFGSSSSICAGSSINLTLANSQTGFNYQLYRDGTALGGGQYNVSGATGVAIDFPVSSAGTYTVVATNNASSTCTNIMNGAPVITINALPSPTASNNGPVCAGQPLSLTGSAGFSSYSWTGPDGFTSNLQSPLVNSSATTAMAGTYTLTVTDGNTCQNTAQTIVVVNTPTVAIATNNGPVCVGSPINLTGGPGGMASYGWTGPSGFTSSSQSPNVTASAVLGTHNGTYTLTIVDGNGCTSTGNTNVVVNTPPVGVVANYNNPVCENGTLNLTALPAGMSYSWTGPNGFTSTLQNPSIPNATNALNAGTYNLTVTNASGCSASASVSVVINALPTASALSSSPVCVGTPLTLTGGAAGLTYSWSGPSGFTSSLQSPTVSATATAAMAGTYTLTVSNALGCQNTAQSIVVVNTPTVAIATNNGPVCVGSPINLTGGPGGMASYGWTGPSGFTSSSQSPNVTANAVFGTHNGTYTLTIVDGNGCTSTANTNVVVNTPPVGVVANYNNPVCDNGTLNLTALPAGMSYSWTGPNGFTSALQNPSIPNATNALNAGTYNLTVTNASGCSASASVSVVVNALPTASALSNSPVCVGTPLTLTGGAAGLTYSWSGPSGFTSSLQSPTVSATATAAMAGTYTLTVSNALGCQNTAQTTVVVNTPTVATAINNGPVCVGSPINLTGGPGGMASYGWTGPSGFTSSSQSPNVTASAVFGTHNGTYTLTIVDGNGCTSTANTNVVVNTPPVGVVANYNNPVCENGTLNLTALPAGMSYSWTGPNGFTSALQNPSIPNATNALNAGTYNLTVTNASGCSASASVSVVINALPTASALSSSPVCVGTPLTLTGGAAGLTYSWSGPSGFTSSLQSPTVSATATAAMAGTYTLTVSNALGCQNTAQSIVVVNTPTVAIATNNGPVCVGSPINLTGGPGGMASYGWTGPSGFTSSSQSPNVTASAVFGTHNGTYTLTIVDGNGCTSTANTNVVVNTPPVGVAANYNNPVCENGTLNLTALPAGMSYSWTGPNGFTSTLQNPSIPNATNALNAGTYNLTVTNASGCSASASVSVVVNALPTASALSNSPVCVGTPLTLTGGAAGLTYSWSGPSGFTSSLQSPTVSATATAAMAGTYTLTVSNALGCQNTAQTTVAVNQIDVTLSVNPPANPSNTKVCVGGTITYQANVAGGSGNYNFTFFQRTLPAGAWNQVYTGTSNIYTIANNLMAGFYEIRVSVVDNVLTCNDEIVSSPFEVIALPVVTLTPSKNGLCLGESLILTALPTGYSNYTFNIDGNAIDNGANNVYTTSSLTVGNHVAYVTVSSGQCAASSNPSLSIDIYPRPTITLISSKPSGFACENEEVTFTASGGNTYQFYVDGNPVGGITANDEFKYNSLNNFTVSVAGFNSNGCEGTIRPTSTITISKPIATLSPLNPSICEGDEVTFTATGGVSYTFAINSSGSVTQPSNTFGPFTNLVNNDVVSVIATDVHGCISPVVNSTVTVNPLPTAVLVSNRPADAVCLNSDITFTASSDIGTEFAFFVDGALVQARSANNVFITGSLTNGQVVTAAAFVVGTNCSRVSNGIAVTVHPLPSVSISASPGLSIIENSEVTFTATLVAGATYEWQVNGNPVGTNSHIYTSSSLVNGDVVSVRLVDTNGCEDTDAVTMSVFDTVQPLTVNVSPVGYCTTAANGVSFTILNPQSGVVYELYRATGDVLIGNGTNLAGVITWSNIKNTTIGAESYYVIGYHPSLPAVRVEMSNRPQVTEYALPVVFNVTPSGTVSDCNGGAGYVIGLDGSEANVSYTLLRDGQPFAGPVVGDGINPVVFTPTITGGTYTVRASLNAVGSCEATMAGNYVIDLSFLGIQYSLVSGTTGNEYCQGTPGVLLSLNGSQAGVDYVLVRTGFGDVMTVTGTGSAISFGQQPAGTYSAEVRSGGCSLAMLNPQTIVMIPNSQTFNVLVDNNGFYCEGSTGVAIALAGQQAGVNYTLLRSGLPVTTVTGTVDDPNLPLSFGLYNVNGTYSVIAVVGTPNCATQMNNSVILTSQELPQSVIFTPVQNAFCQGSSVDLVIENARANTDYYLLLNGSETGAVVNGNNPQPWVFNVNQAGTYGLKAVLTNTNTSCESVLSNSLVITETALPLQRNVVMVAGTGTACDNGAVIRVENSEAGIIYTLLRNGVATSQVLTGTGADLNFLPVVDKNADYTVSAQSNPGACDVLMVSAPINVAIPGVVESFTVTIDPTTTLCADNTSGYIIGLSGSEIGVEYTLSDGSNNLGTVVGTGANISFTAVSTSGTYAVRAVNPTDPTCEVLMPNTVVVSYNALPIPTLVSDFGTTIINGQSLTFTATGGLYYEFAINGNVLQSSSFDETFGPISTLANNDIVSVLVTDGNGCQASELLTISVLGDIIPRPVSANVYGYCTTSATGVNIILSNPQADITYELVRVGTNDNLGTGALVGSEIIWTDIKNLGIGAEEYKVEAFYTSVPSVRIEMGNRVTITEYAVPVAFDLTPNSVVTDCAAPTGHTINLSGSEPFYLYSLYVNGFNTGNSQLGTGGALVFNNVLTVGVHTIVASIPNANSCETTMNGAFIVQIAGGVVHKMVTDRADGQFCEGSDGVIFSLDNSETGVSYTLMNGSVAVATAVGTGSALPIDTLAVEGTYMVYADLSGCMLPMNGSVTTSQVDLPTAFALSAENNGEYCADDTDGVEIRLEGQQFGYTYELLRDGVLVNTIVSPHAATSTWLSFGNYIPTGVYTVNAIAPALGCSNVMNNSVTISSQPLPAIYAFLAESSVYCQGGSTILYIPNSAVGTSYQLLHNSVVIGLPVAGNGNRIDFSVSQTGTYKVEATRIHTSVSCSSVMDDADAIIVTESPLPDVKVVTFIDGTDCDNGTKITVEQTQVGIEYLVVNAVSGADVPGYVLNGDGNDLTFADLFDNGGSYNVIARNSNGCEITLTTTPIAVNILGVVTKQTISVPSSICLGDDGVVITLDGSELNIQYSLISNSLVIETVTGTGSSINFTKVNNEGEYWVIGQNAIAPLCPNEMMNRVTIQYNPLPLAFNLNGSGFYCDAANPAIISLPQSEWEVDYTLMYQTTNGKVFIQTIPGNYYGDTIYFAGVSTEGVYSVFAKTSLGCTSSMKDNVTVVTKTTPVAFDVTVPETQYCVSNGGAEVYLSGMQKDVTYQVVNTSTAAVTEIIGFADAVSTTLLTKVPAGTYNVYATWGGDACQVLLQPSPFVVTEAPVATIAPDFTIDENVVCAGQINMVRVTNAAANTVYDLMVDGMAQNLAINSDTASVEWPFVGDVGVMKVVTVKAYIDGFVDCGLLSSNVEFVETKASPIMFNVSPIDTTYCLGEPGIKVELSGCEPDVFYELYNVHTGDRVDYYLPSPAETAAGSAFKFRASQFEGDYWVQGRYLSGGCISLMNDTSHIVLDDFTGNCIPLVAVDDLISMGKSDVTVNDSIYLNDIYNSMIDTVGSNLEYTLITNWIYFDGKNSINVETLGEASINQNGVLTYTKLPGFFGRDSVKYIVQNTNEPSRVDTALVIIMVGNQSLEDGTLLIPNMITPNGDAYNQTLVISGLIEDKLVDINDSRVKSTLEIYNRWGTLVYKSKGEKYMNDWDGRGNGPMASIGDELPSGTYYYIFKITFSLTDKIVNKTYNGFVEIAR